ncbi:MAG: aldo/keto reductase [Bacteroidales bacterium]|nr:aldo/keto reductase [Bacteroidales bacterium]
MAQEQRTMSRREAIRHIGFGTLMLAGGFTLATGCKGKNSDKPGKYVMAMRKDNVTGREVSLLGYGCMRFPTFETDELDNRGRKIKAIDMKKSQEIIDYAIANGINHFDTAWNYHNEKSAVAIGQMLKKYPRENFTLANKMPGWLITSPEKAQELFDEQLRRCDVEYFDYYLCHAISEKEGYDKPYEEFGGYDVLAKEKEKGRIKRLGFSFHGDKELFTYLLNKRPWDFVLLQINYIDWVDQEAEFFYNELVKRGIQCMVMEPLKGGALASLTPDANEILLDYAPDKSVASWAFRYVGSLPNVLTVLSGMTKMEHLKDNLATFTNFQPLTEEERGVLDRAIAEYRRYKQIGCTACKYCMPCKYGVDIPAVFEAYNKCVKESNIPDMEGPRDAKFNKKKRAFLATYYNTVPEGARAERCISCGECQTLCPQKLNVPELIFKMKNMVKELEK